MLCIILLEEVVMDWVVLHITILCHWLNVLVPTTCTDTSQSMTTTKRYQCPLKSGTQIDVHPSRKTELLQIILDPRVLSYTIIDLCCHSSI